MTYDTDPAAAGDTTPVSTDDSEERVERGTGSYGDATDAGATSDQGAEHGGA